MTRVRIVGLLLGFITLLVYLPATWNDFVNYDDGSYVTDNPIVKRGLTLDGVESAFTQIHASNWHPVTWLSHMIDCEVFRLNPAGHHLTSVLIHAANVVLLFALLFRLTGCLWSGAFIAGLFSCHPLHVESVAWIAERKDVLSTFFALLTLLAYVRYVRCKSEFKDTLTAGRGNRFAPIPRWRNGAYFYWLSLMLFAWGLMSKPMVVTLPFLMLLLDFWPLTRPQLIRFLFLEKLPFLLLTIISCLVTVVAQHDRAMASLKQVALGARLENAVAAYLGYLLKMVWPMDLAVLYPLPRHISIYAVVTASMILAVISVISWCQRFRRPYLLVGWLWYLGSLVPVIGLVQVGEQAMADRYTYIPSIGIFLALTFIVKEMAERLHLSTRLVGLPAGAVLLTCVFLTEKQIAFWHDSQTLFSHALAVTKNNAVAHINLGAAFEDQKRLADALTEYQQAAKISPGNAMAYNNIGRILSKQDKPQEALPYCKSAVRLDPQHPYYHDSMGIVLVQLDDYEGAKEQFSEALKLDADYSPAYYQMGRLLLKQGKDVEGSKYLRQALNIDPNNYGMLIYTARVLAADENPLVRNGGESLKLASAAADLASKNEYVVYDTLGMAYAENGRFDEAVQNAQQAIHLARKQGQQEDVLVMQKRLDLYEEQHPWRESFLNQGPFFQRY